MITGTATALLVHADATYALLAVWLLALSSVLIKAFRLSWDVLELHIPVFLLQGCVVVLGCVASDVALSAWALQCAVWKSTSELCSTSSSRRDHGDDVASMAWGV